MSKSIIDTQSTHTTKRKHFLSHLQDNFGDDINRQTNTFALEFGESRAESAERCETKDETHGMRADADQGHDVLVLERHQDRQLLAHVQVRFARVLGRVLQPAS